MPASDRPLARDVDLDALRAIAAQLIVLHHLFIYGVAHEMARPLAPALHDWLDGYARMAVQVFLVVGGCLAARGLARDGVPMAGAWWRPVLARYRRLAGPFVVAMLLAIVLSAASRAIIALPDTPPAPTSGQMLAHALLLHGVLHVPSLSAGVWYVAIDFQLHALLAALIWLAARVAGDPARRRGVLFAAVFAIGCASLLGFNRDADWDDWAPYFFGAYSLGAFAGWAGVGHAQSVGEPDAGRAATRWWLALAAVTMLALALDFRARIAIALACAMVIVAGRRTGCLAHVGGAPAFAGLARISYAVFLVHYPVCTLIDSIVARVWPGQVNAALAGMAMSWIASNLVGWGFHQGVERRWLRRG